MSKSDDPSLMSTALRRNLLVLLIVFATTIAFGAPINDHFTDRIVLSGAAVTVAGTTVDGTLEAGEPQVYHEFSTVWYEWTAPEQGSLRVRIIDSPNTIAEMYRGNALPDLHFVGRANSLREANVDVVAGAVYQFRVTVSQDVPFPRVEEPFTLRLEFNAAPVNDHFTNRIRLSNAVERIVFRSLLATLEPGESSVASYGGGHSVWYEWRAPSNGEAHLLSGSAVGVYNGTLYDRGTMIASNVLEAGRVSAEVIFNAVAGQVYHLVVDTTGSESQVDGGFTLTLNGAARLERLVRGSDGTIQVAVIGEWYRYYALETSTNLTHWASISTNIYIGYDALMLEHVAAPSSAMNFYRVRVVEP